MRRPRRNGSWRPATMFGANLLLWGLLMPEWIGEALASARRGEALAMVTIVGAQGSTPREKGARMLVWPDRFTGTIGGGSLERQGLDQARKLLSQATRRHA